jgi:hypothetical protein
MHCENLVRVVVSEDLQSADIANNIGHVSGALGRYIDVDVSSQDLVSAPKIELDHNKPLLFPDRPVSNELP